MGAEEKLAIAVKALQEYAGKTLYQYPEDWNCLKAGGHPSMDDYEEINDFASEALALIEGD